MSDVAPEGASGDDFDLDAAVEDFSQNAPEEWKSKASSINRELKALREKSKSTSEVSSRFDGLNDSVKESLLGFVDLVKGGDQDEVVKWLVGSAHGLAGEKFADFVADLTPKEQEQVAEVVEDAIDEGFSPAKVQKMIEDALAERDNASKKESEEKAALDRIKSEIEEVGLTWDSFESKMVLTLARDDKSSVKDAFAKFETFMADNAKNFLQSKQGQTVLSDDNTPATQEKDGLKGLTLDEKLREIINRESKIGQ